MANRSFELKRNVGADTYDVLLPKTHVGVIYTDDTLTTTLQSVLDNKISVGQKGVANGVATLNSSGKVPYSQLPDDVFASLHWEGAFTTNPTNLDTIAADLVVDYGYEGASGKFFIAASTLDITGTNSVVQAPGDEGDSTLPITVEAGDWVVLVDYKLDGVPTWAIINNTYSNATTTAPGVVRITNASEISAATTDTGVVTAQLLGTYIGTSAGTIAAGNHNHSGTYQPLDSDLTTIAGLTPADGNIIVGNGSSWITESGATARTSLGLTIGTNVQAYDAGLQSIAGLTTSANKMIYTTAPDVYATTNLTAFGRSLIDDADAATARSTLGLVIGTDVQERSIGLDEIAMIAPLEGNFIVGNETGWVGKSGAAARAALGVYSTSDVDGFFTNRPKIFYDTTTGSVSGDYIIDII